MYLGVMKVDDEIKKKLANRIQERSLGLTELSAKIGTSYSTLWNFLYGQTRNFSKLPQLANLLDFSLQDVFKINSSETKDSIKNKLQPQVVGSIERLSASEEVIPVYGPSPGGGSVKLLPENIVGHIGTFTDHVRQYKSLFAVTMVGDTMFPRHKHGWRVRAAGNTIPQNGDDCILQFKDDELKIFEFVRQTAKEYIVKTLKPEKQFHFPFSEVKAIHLVIR